jgi:hypothetical protein
LKQNLESLLNEKHKIIEKTDKSLNETKELLEKFILIKNEEDTEKKKDSDE